MTDLIIIGGGPAGYTAAEYAAKSSMSVVLFEKDELGGVCLNEGCIPTKTIMYSTKLYESIRLDGKKYGVMTDGLKLDIPTIIARKDKTVKLLKAGVQGALRKAGVTVVNEKAVIAGHNNNRFIVTCESGAYSAAYILIATGSRPLIPDIDGMSAAFAGGFAVTSRQMLEFKTVPRNLIIIGGGVIGIEMASIYNAAGSAVTVVESLDKIGGFADMEISKLLQASMEKKGIVFKLNARVTQIKRPGITYTSGSAAYTINADTVLVSAGRRARTDGIGLKELGLGQHIGALYTDAYMRTSIPNLYCAGDANGKSMLAHTAYREAEVAVNAMLGRTDDPINYDAIPSVIYGSPEVAWIGETLDSARKKGFSDAKEHKVSMRFSGRYIAENDGGNGIAKIITAANSNGLGKDTCSDKTPHQSSGCGRKIIGAHFISNMSSEVISTLSLAMNSGLTIEETASTVYPHPSISEIIKHIAQQI